MYVNFGCDYVDNVLVFGMVFVIIQYCFVVVMCELYVWSNNSYIGIKLLCMVVSFVL